MSEVHGKEKFEEDAFDEEEELGSEETANLHYNDSPDAPKRESVAKVLEAINADGTLRKIIRARRSDFVANIIHLDGKKFSFDGRDYLRPVYDRDDRQILLKTARQVEKCLTYQTLITKSNGERIKASEIKVGDKVISFNNFRPEEDKVSAISENGKKKVIKIATKKKRSVTVTLNHPFRTLLGWTKAEDLKVGDFVALPHMAGNFGDLNDTLSANLLGHLLAEGHFRKTYVDFTQSPNKNVEEFLGNCRKRGVYVPFKTLPCRPNIGRVRIPSDNEVFDFIKPYMEGKKSSTLVIPRWIYEADKETLVNFLRGLWGGDGSSITNEGDRNAIDLCYSTTSKELVYSVQDLLLKFGIMTVIRENKPTLYKGTDKLAYILRVIDERSFKRFHEILGDVPDKEFSLEGHGGKDQSDIIPREVGILIKQVTKIEGKMRAYGENTLCKYGLRAKPEYNLQRNKFFKYCELLNDQRLWDIYNGEIYWDPISSIEEVGEEDTLAIEIEKNKNFITDGIITHNTTFVGNNLTITSVVMPYNKALYVSPSHTQTRQFSNEKLRPAIEKSPLIKKYFQDSSVSTQVFEKGFLNGSYIFLRSAFRSADRCLVEGTKVTLSSGLTKKIENLDVGDEVISYDGGKTTTGVVSGKVFNGEKDTITLTLESGHAITGSVNHRFLTQDGLKRLDAITTDDFIPIPLNYLKTEGSHGYLSLWIGLLLGDGCVSRRNEHAYHRNFNNNSLELIELFEEWSGELGFSTKRSQRIQGGKLNYTTELLEKDKANDLFRSLGILGKGQFDKFIPERFFVTRRSISAVLLGLFESNGWIAFNTKTRQAEIGFVTGSHRMALDVQRGLQSVGVYSTIQIRDPRKGSKQKHRWYTIKIRNTSHIKRFGKVVGFSSKEKREKFEDCLQFLNTLTETSARDLDVPARNDCAEAIKRFGISTHELWKKHQISFRCNSKMGPCIAQHNVRAIREITKDPSLDKWLNPDIAWIPVNNTSGGSKLRTWDIQVDPHALFVAEGMFTHNTRGISARILCLDEIQDFLGSEIPVIMECTSHFLDARILMAGTPKSLNNPIEEYWKSTTQNEWIVKCHHCGHQNFLDETNIAPTEWYVKGKLPPGPVCKKCTKPIYPSQHGRWVSFNAGAPIQGYRIPQLMVPWICGLYDQWLKLLWKRDKYPLGQFYNEVLGISYESASKPITQDELAACCASYSMWDPNNLAPHIQEAKRYQLTAGIDWGEGIDGSEKSPTGKQRTASYTVLSIGAYINQKVWKTFLMKRYMGKEIEPDYIVKDAAKIIRALDVKLLGVDWGHGWGVNNHLIRILGPKMVVQYQHLPKLKQKMKWDHTALRYHLLRNFFMSELFFDMKHKFIMFPRWAEFQPFAKDILAIYSEYVEFRREIKYDHSSQTPDDAFHSLLYAKLTSDVYLGKSRRYTFDIPEGVGAGQASLF